MASGAFAGADAKRRAAKWRCPTGECSPASRWIGAPRLHTLIPWGTARWKKFYRHLGAVDREFGRLKNDWALLPCASGPSTGFGSTPT